MCYIGNEKEEMKICDYIEVNEEGVSLEEKPIVHIRTKRSYQQVVHRIPIMVTKIETHIYYHHYEVDKSECLIRKCKHVYINDENKDI